MAEAPPVPGPAPSALDYASADSPARRRHWPLPLIVTVAHLSASYLVMMDQAGEDYFPAYASHTLLIPLVLAAEVGWTDWGSMRVFLFVLLPLNSILYGCVLAALALLIARSRRLLAIAAGVSLAYPVLFAILLYGQWLTAWAVLGHPPRSSLDDPAQVPVAGTMYVATAISLLAIPLAGCAAIALNATHALFARPTTPRVVARFVLLAVLWAGLATVFIWDPGRVLYWWFD